MVKGIVAAIATGVSEGAMAMTMAPRLFTCSMALISVVVLPDWGWASPNYEFTIDKPKEKIKSIRLNEEGLVADVDVTNDIFVVE